MESLGGTVGFVTALAGATRNPIFEMPEFWIARTSIGIERFCDATAPGVGEIKMTWSACTFDRKMESVSSAKLPAPSVARPTIVMLPPAPEFDGNVIERPDEPAAERQVHALQRQIVDRGHVEVETAGDSLRVARGVRERDGWWCDVALDAANVARRLARPDGECERAHAEQCGTASDSNQPHGYPLLLSARPTGRSARRDRR